ncbi:hypothetical protein C8Q77DRAFT_1059025 [Trametes polyzona]|nr:hypothetical protein C8Q77DRAFT_1059025 [Trametes polyzona]
MDMSPPGASPMDSLAILLPSYTASVFFEAMLFGAYAVTFLMGAWSLLRLDALSRPSRRDLVILAVNSLMFILALSHLILSIVVTQYDILDSISDGLYKASNMTSRLGAARFCIYVTQTMICDTFMIYRAFVIWERSWKIIALPAMLLILDVVSRYISTSTAGDGLAMMVVFPCASFLANTLSTGTYLVLLASIERLGLSKLTQASRPAHTALIMWRVLRGAGGVQPTRFTLYRQVLKAIVQSAAIYSTASIVLLIAVIVSPDSAYATCLTMFPPFIGLIFSFVVLRLARRTGASRATSGAEGSRAQWYEHAGPRGAAVLPMTAAEGAAVQLARPAHAFQAPPIHLPALGTYHVDVETQRARAQALLSEKTTGGDGDESVRGCDDHSRLSRSASSASDSSGH